MKSPWIRKEMWQTVLSNKQPLFVPYSVYVTSKEIVLHKQYSILMTVAFITANIDISYHTISSRLMSTCNFHALCRYHEIYTHAHRHTLVWFCLCSRKMMPSLIPLGMEYFDWETVRIVLCIQHTFSLFLPIQMHSAYLNLSNMSI